MADLYDNSFFPELANKAPDMVGALGGGYDLGRKMYVNQQLPALMQASANGDINARAQAQALDPSAAYQAALGNQAQTTADQTKLLTVARLSNGLSDTLKNSADDTAKQNALDAFSTIAKQAGVPIPASITDSSIPMAQREATVHNIAQQTQSTMTAGILGKGVGSAYVQSLVASGVPMQQALQMEQQQQARIVTDPNGNIYQPSPNGPVQYNPVSGGKTVLGGNAGPNPALAGIPQSSAPMASPPSGPVPNNALPIDGTQPAVQIAGAPIQTPQPSAAGQVSLAAQPQDQGSIQIPAKPSDIGGPPPTAGLVQAKQASLQTPGVPVALPNGGFMRDGKYYDSIAKTNPVQEQKSFDKTAEPYIDSKDGLDAQIKAAQNQINLAKQLQVISPNADSGELADYIQKGKSGLESVGLLPPNSNASNNDVMKAIAGQYIAGIMGGDNSVKNIRNKMEFESVTAEAPKLITTASGREKIAALTQAVAQAKLQSAQMYQQAVSDRSIQNPDVKQALQDSYGKALDAIPVYGITNYDSPKYADKVRQSLEAGYSKPEIIQMINKQDANANP